MLMRFFIAVFFITLSINVSSAEKRIALVIGNSDYQYFPLDNPKHDAALIARTLHEVGFDVIEATDVTQRQMKRAIKSFGKQLREAGKSSVGLFYYAGHGAQVKGKNYLIPVNAEIDSEADVDIEAVDGNNVLTQMESAGGRLNIVILDACRNNPFLRSSRSSTRGLARMEAAKGSLIAYSTAPGSVAADGNGRNSPYTQSLVSLIKTPGMPVERLFREVRNQVDQITDGKQTPWESSSLIGGDFYFTPEKPPSAQENTISPTVQQLTPAYNEELIFWQSVKGSSSPLLYKSYLNAYPQGRFSELARVKIQLLTGEAQQAKPKDKRSDQYEDTPLTQDADSGDENPNRYTTCTTHFIYNPECL